MSRHTLSYLNTIKAAKEKGYSVTLFYFLLNDVNPAVERFKTRVSEGGHNILEETKRRRYLGVSIIEPIVSLLHFVITGSL